MAKCPFCGSEVEETAKFCLTCGGKLTEDTPVSTAGDIINELGNTANTYMNALDNTVSSTASTLNQAAPTVDVNSGAYPTSTPAFTSAPVYGNAPVNNGAPVYGNAPVNGNAPVYGTTPAYTAYATAPEQPKPRKKAGLIVLIAAGVLLTFVLGLFAIGSLTGPTVSTNGYSTYEELADAYVKAMMNKGYKSALNAYIPQVLNYYKDGLGDNPTDILNIADDAFAADAYANAKGYEFGETVEWKVADYYEEIFDELGISAVDGVDLQVYFTWKDGSESDYYVLETVKINGRWYLLSVYY